MSVETEVFRLSEFKPDKCYEFALYTRIEGKGLTQKYFTTNKLQYLGKWTKSERWGYGDDSGGAEHFDENGTKNTIVYDSDGKTCFKPVECKVAKGEGGRKIKTKSKRNRKNKKSKRIRKSTRRR
jgi:hypothetical protein